MGSVGNPVSSPYSLPTFGSNDCLQVPQLCIPAPDPDDDNSGTSFSPLIIALITILGTGFLLIIYYFFFSKYCKRQRMSDQQTPPSTGDHLIVHRSGLDNSSIESITVFKYRRGDGLVESIECAVCLSEFKEDESLRLLPNCSHAFHIHCIDAWLKSNSNCPLCRANGDPFLPPPQQLYAL